MTDLLFLPWEKTVCTCEGHDWGGGYIDVPVLEEFKPYAAAFSSGDTCHEDWFVLEIGISPVCSLEGIGFLDRIHEAETISRIRLSRGMAPWHVEVHFDVYHFKSGLDLPWLQFHYFGPFDWPFSGHVERLTRFADTVIPYLCEHALVITEYAWPLRQPYGGS